MAYVYRHIRLDKNVPFYIGIGGDIFYSRAKTKHNRSDIWIRVVAKTAYEIEIMMDGISWEYVREKEKEFIKLYGRVKDGTGTLVNLTDGGDGVLGFKFSQEAKDKQAERYSRPVAKYNLDGEFIQHYISSIDAERKTGILNTTIGRCANFKKGAFVAGGFLWRWFNGNTDSIVFDKDEYARLCGRKRVSVYSKQGVFKGTYRSLSEAGASVGLTPKHVVNVLKGRHIASGGYIFRYDNGSRVNIDVSGLYKNREGENSPIFGRKGKLAPAYGIRGAKRASSKPVYQIDRKTNEIIKEFENSGFAKDELGIDRSAIAACCRGVIKTAGGYIWKYK